MSAPVTLENVQRVEDIAGTKTELVVTPFADRIFVVVTQNGKLGTLMSAYRDEEVGDSETFTVQTLMGRRDEELLDVFARRMVQQACAAGETRPLLISACFEEHEPATVKAALRFVLRTCGWEQAGE